jgi:hypothetical protein
MNGTVEIGCDGDSALHDCTEEWKRTDANKDHFDLVSTTREVMAKCPVTWKHTYIAGHQDDKQNAVLDR